jgi:cell division protein FtsI/penicillin-binding protein 2
MPCSSAYAPYDNPQYAMSVVVEHGTSGGAAAAPLARERDDGRATASG